MSRGGKNIKVHALVTEKFQLIGLLLSGGQVHDSQYVVEILSKVNFEGKIVLGDKDFYSAQIRDFIQSREAEVCIPYKTKFAMSLNIFSCV